MRIVAFFIKFVVSVSLLMTKFAPNNNYQIMKTKTWKIVLLSLVIMIGGFCLGAYVGWPTSGDTMLSGNVAKANKFKKDVASPELKLFEEKLLADEDFKNQTITSLSFINSRIGEFKEYSTMAVEATADIEELKESNAVMKELSAFATNAEKSSGDALEALNLILSGRKDVNYEELSNNAVLSYLLLNNSISAASNFVSQADAFLATKDIANYQFLAFVRDRWAIYNTLDAIYSDNKELMAFWSDKELLLDDKVSKQVVASLKLEGYWYPRNNEALKGGLNNKQVLKVMCDNRQALNGAIFMKNSQMNNASQLNVAFPANLFQLNAILLQNN